MKYLYRGAYMYNTPEKNARQQLTTVGFTETDLSIGAITVVNKQLFKVLVKETFTDDCAELEPIKVEYARCIEKTETGYKIHWDMLE